MTGDAPLPTRFSFRLVQPEDLPLLTRWRHAEHVTRWWGEPGDLEAEYFRHGEPVRYYLALLDDEPVGLIENHGWSDYPSEAEARGAQPDEEGIDYFLGEPELLGQSLGPAMLTAFIGQVITTRPETRGVRLDVAEANRRSWRCLEKLGFQRTLSGITVELEPGPHYVYALRFDDE